jgi:predicted anti-sigma-YlaC factor YlaD
MKGSKTVLAMILVTVMVDSGCSIRRFAVNKVGDALSRGGSTYESDDDLELVGDALPFSLKLIESLLAESPRHRGMLETACKGFATYSYIYVQNEADRVADNNVARARAMRERSRRLYLRASRYGLRGLEVAYPGITDRLEIDPAEAVTAVQAKDVSLLYWNAVALGLAISVSKDDAAMLARLPAVESMLSRALELDESWNRGALHEFRLTLASARLGPPDYEELAADFERARTLSDGMSAGLYVAYADAVAVPRQDVAQFRSLIGQALDVDPDEREETRLANLVAQRNARSLLRRIDDLFLDVESSDAGQEGGTP